MTRILQCGFETGDTAQEGSDIASGTSTVAVVSSSPTPRSGNYCLRCQLTFGGGEVASKRFAHGTLSEVWYAFAIYQHPTNADIANMVFFRAYAPDAWMQMALVWDLGVIRAYYSNSTSATGGIIASSSSAYSVDNWHLVEIHYIPNKTSGTLEVWVDGALAISATGVRTSNTSSTVQTVSDFALEFYRNGTSGSPAVNGMYMAFDDLRVNNTLGTVNNGKPGDGKIIGLVPNGAGNYTQLTPTTAPNWDCVNETPPNTSDYVSHSSIGQKDTYAFTDPVTAGNIQAVSVIVMAQNADGGGGSVGILVRSGGVDNEGSPTPITASWGFYKRIMENDPTDSNPWTTAKLTAIEAGVAIR